MYIICPLTAIWNVQSIFIRICVAIATWIFHMYIIIRVLNCFLDGTHECFAFISLSDRGEVGLP